MSNLRYLFSVLIIMALVTLSSCDKDSGTTGDPVAGVPSIALKAEDNIAVGATQKLDMTITSLQPLVKVKVTAKVTKKDGSKYADSILLDTSLNSSLALKIERNVYWTCPKTFVVGDKVTFTIKAETAANFGEAIKNCSITAPSIGLTLNQDKTEASKGETVKFSIYAGTSGVMSKFQIMEQGGATLLDSTLTSGLDYFGYTYNYVVPSTAKSGDTKKLTFKAMNTFGTIKEETKDIKIK